MAPVDLIPTAPPKKVAEEQYTPLYPTLQEPVLPNTETFRLTEINKMEKQSSDEEEHYRLVLKKYEKAQKTLNWGVAGLGIATTGMSSGVVASAITGVGIVVSVPLGVVSVVCGLVSTVLSAVNKKVEKKVNKHSRLSALAAAKHDTIRSFVSQALDDNRVSDAEFKHITHEMKS